MRPISRTGVYRLESWSQENSDKNCRNIFFWILRLFPLRPCREWIRWERQFRQRKVRLKHMGLSLSQYPKSTGIELWRGESRYDRAPIVALAVFHSSNRKTGDMVQTYILRSDIVPTDAVRTGDDMSICGECPHRRTAEGTRSCYVNVGQSVNAVYRTFMAGKYPRVPLADAARMVRGRAVRLGAYGDPAMVPDSIWRGFIAEASGHTGYTHQWDAAPEYRDLCMASVDSEAEARAAWATGWRTFRVREASDATLAGEVTCPASKEAGARTQCDRCRLCAGNPQRKGLRPGIVIVRH